MPKQKQESQSAHVAKRKLRTAADVISRLRWADDESSAGASIGGILIGYDDRINGPMEKPLEDYTRVDQGGDIPEHRIQYFRRDVDNGSNIDESYILWDRAGRVDRVFGSGVGPNALVSASTRAQVVDAITNMKRLDNEKKERRIQRDKERERRARQRARKAAALQEVLSRKSSFTEYESSETIPLPRKHDRYAWKPVNWYKYADQTGKWETGTKARENPKSSSRRDVREGSDLVVVTWNVLFDLYDNEIINDSQQDENGAPCVDSDTIQRWELLAKSLESTNADIIALQEVTPRFVKILLSQEWAKTNFITSTSPLHSETVNPTGNLIMWRYDKLSVAYKTNGFFMCEDGPRKRSMIAALEYVNNPSVVVLCANVHLQADKKGEVDSRTLARQRELGAVLGKLQMIEQSILGKGKDVQVIPMIIGDFNTDQDMVGPHFQDAWPFVSNGKRSFTFDPKTNVRASMTKARTQSSRGPRVIDRIQVARYWNLSTAQQDSPMLPVDGSLIGVAGEDGLNVPPSDHYGLRVSFDIKARKSYPLLSGPNGHNVWAATAVSTHDTLLALVLDEGSIGGTELYESMSSLPIPHVTLLHGFVELDCEESRSLATHSVANAIRLALGDMPHGAWSLPFNKNSLSVFEHHNSATLVCLPDTDNEEGRWLLQLYNTLRATFCLCRDQESRFQEGWTPHLSIGSYGTANAARSEMNRILAAGTWPQDGQSISINAIGIYQRDPTDGKLYAVSSVPLAPRPRNAIQCNTVDFLRDAGVSWSLYMRGLCTPAVLDVERTCQATIASKIDGQIQATSQVYGSHGMNASLPFTSDVDAVVKVQPIAGALKADKELLRLSTREVLLNVASCIKGRYKNAKARMRVALGGLHVLTIKLWPHAPSIDLQLCFLGINGEPMDTKSSIALKATQDSSMILDLARSCSMLLPTGLDTVKVFEGALRIVKLWAHRRQIYGGSMGYLGGCGWALMVARAMHDGLREPKLAIPHDASHGQASVLVAAHFFKLASTWSRPIHITLPTSNVENKVIGSPKDVADNAVAMRDTMAVIAPVSGGNFGRSATRSTAQTTSQELQRAARILCKSESIQDGLEQVLYSHSLQEFLMSFSSIVVVEVAIPNTEEAPLPADIKAWGCSHLLNVVVALERVVGDPSLIRPRAKPLRSNGCFCYLVGVNTSRQELRDFVSKRSTALEADLQGFFGINSMVEGRIDCLTSTEALDHLVKPV